MPPPVQLSAVVEQLELADDEWHANINCKTGEIVAFSNEIRRAVEKESPLGIPPWATEMAEGCRRALDDPDFIPLPSKYQIHEYDIMRRFCRERTDADERDELLDAIAGRGAFRMFKSTIHRRRIEQDWYRYREQALKRIAADFLEAHNIPYVDDPAAPPRPEVGQT
jgi:hypothetical protein